ncbi:MAG: aminotransferase class IV [Alphaproteobacteria bacterium]|nr:aminotransferase class IV [Alphaproteobacteria bacterium]
MSIIWHNGVFTENAPVFTAQDRVRLGDGVFDTMLAVDGKPVYPELHFERLVRHAAVLGIAAAALQTEIVQELLERNNFQQGRHAVRTIVTRGPGEGLNIPDQREIQIVMTASTASATHVPLNAVICETVRRNEGSPLSRIKSLNYGDSVLALREASERGGNEAILLNNRGEVAGTAAGNIFVLKNGTLLTPPLQDGAMDGIIRAQLIKRQGAREQSLTSSDLWNNSGIYITSSIRGVVPVLTLDGKPVAAPSLKINKDFHLL